MEARFWILTLTPLLALLCYAILLVLVIARARRYRLYRFFALYLLSMAVWSLGSALMRLDPSHILLWYKILNGGAVNDQKGFDFGNETDGWYYAGSSWMYGMTLAAGTPASGPSSSHPYDPAHAFREHLAHVLTRLDDQGRATSVTRYRNTQGPAAQQIRTHGPLRQTVLGP